VQRSAEDQVRRECVQLQVRFPRTYGKPQLVERAVPLRWRPVIVEQGNIMTRVTHPVHKSQGRVGKRSFKQVILDKNEPVERHELPPQGGSLARQCDAARQ